MAARSQRLTKTEIRKLKSALAAHRITVVRSFLDRGWNPAELLDGENPLNYCDSTSMGKLLLKAGANVNAGEHNWTPVLFNSDVGNEKLVTLLIQSGADVNKAYSKRKCPQIPFGTTPLMKAAGHGYLGIVKRLLGAGANLDALDEHGHNALFRALYSDQTGTAQELINRGSRLTDDALGGPVVHGNVNILQTLIGKQANVNYTMKGFKGLDFFIEGETLLGCAISKVGSFGYPLKIVKMLIEAGADVNRPTEYLGERVHPMAIAATRGHEDVIDLLKKAGATISLREALKGWTLHGASYAGRTKVVKLLLKAGYDVNAPGPEGKRPIDFARERGHSRIVDLLLRAGAERD